jgi:hypothetical protein
MSFFASSDFFHESSFPKPLMIPKAPIQYFCELAEIFVSQGAPPKLIIGVVDTSSKFSQVSLTSVFTPFLGFKLTTCIADTCGKFATGINNSV